MAVATDLGCHPPAQAQLDPTNASQSPDYIPFTMPRLVQQALPLLRPVILSAPVLALAAKGIASKGL